jgi:DHA1 family tetracycline resistance protein-like MFS transporter
VGPGEQGRLQGALASLRGIVAVIGPVIFTQTFAVAIGARDGVHVPGAPYLLAASMLVVSLVLVRRLDTQRG